MVVPLNQLVVAQHLSVRRVDRDDRMGIKVVACAPFTVEVRHRIARGNVQHAIGFIEGERCPERTAGDRILRICPRRARWPSRRHNVEPPHHVNVLGIQRINVAGHIDLITAGVSDVDQPVRGDRRHWYRDARSVRIDLLIPELVAVCRIHRKHVRVRGASKEPSVRVGESAVHEQSAWRIAVPMLFPLLRACGHIDRIRPSSVVKYIVTSTKSGAV